MRQTVNFNEVDNKLEVILTKQQRQVARAAAKEDTRPVLQGAKIGNGKIIAADGFILAECPVESKGNAVVLVDAASLVKAKDVKEMGGTPLVYNGNGEAKLLTKDSALTLPCIDGTYPNIDALYPKEDEVFHIAISPTILKQVAAIAGEETLIKFRFYGTSNPVKFEAGETKGCLMPMSCKWD